MIGHPQSLLIRVEHRKLDRLINVLPYSHFSSPSQTQQCRAPLVPVCNVVRDRGGIGISGPGNGRNKRGVARLHQLQAVTAPERCHLSDHGGGLSRAATHLRRDRYFRCPARRIAWAWDRRHCTERRRAIPLTLSPRKPLDLNSRYHSGHRVSAGAARSFVASKRVLGRSLAFCSLVPPAGTSG